MLPQNTRGEGLKKKREPVAANIGNWVFAELRMKGNGQN
jgi:hypothetical protein